jgi:Transferase family
MDATFDVRVVSSTRIFAKTPLATFRSVPLSIIDATVVNFAHSGAVWFFSPNASSFSSILPASLKSALEQTLDAYPQFCGRLHWAAYCEGGLHTERWGRLSLSYGSSDGKDPGVEFVVAESDATLSSFLPSPIERSRGLGVWDASQANSTLLVPSTKLAPGPSPVSLNGEEGGAADAPCLVVQLTNFSCGGSAIAIQAPHPVADALALSFFADDLATSARSLARSVTQQSPSPTLSKTPPIFNPSLLDRYAAGNIDGLHSEATLIRVARTLPCHRYDWWDPKSASGCPWPTTATVVPTAARVDQAIFDREAGTSMPWDDWDVSKPVAHYLIHFSEPEIRSMWEAASTQGYISKHDALLAHI